jgi:hypothetical protein
MINNQTMEMALGLPVFIEGFADKKARLCYPFTLERLTMANLYLSGFDNHDLYKNFKDETAVTAMACFFREAFRPTNDQDAEELLHAINQDNFAEIVKDVKKVSGIKDKDGKEVDIQKTTETMEWLTAVNSIPVYTSTPHHKVKDLTLTQFQETLRLIGKQINFTYKMNTIGLVEKPNKYITDSDFPLHSEPVYDDDNKKHVTMKDVEGLFNLM